MTSDRTRFFDLAVHKLLDESGAFPLLTDDPAITARQVERWRPGSAVTEDHSAGASSPTGWWPNVHPEQAYARTMRAVRKRPLGGHWLVAFDSEPFSALVAATRAVFDSRPFQIVDDSQEGFGAISRHPDIQSVCVVTEHLSVERIRLVQRWTAALDPPPRRDPFPRVVPLGFLHARTPGLLTFLDLKQRCSQAGTDPDLVVVPTLDRDMPDPVGYLVLNRSSTSAEDLASRSTDVFSLTAHGRSDLCFIGRDCLCGLADGTDPGQFRSRTNVPACMRPPYRCFRADGAQLRIQQLRARHIMINSCGSLAVSDSEFGPEFNLSYGALEGCAESYIGTTRWKDGDIHESFLFAQALRHGYNLGEATVLLNCALHHGNYEHCEDVFVLLGDPRAGVSPHQSAPSPDMSRGRRADLNLTAPAHFVFLEDEQLAQACQAGAMETRVRGLGDVFCSAAAAASPAGAGVLVTITAPHIRQFPAVGTLECAADSSSLVRPLTAYRHLSAQLDPVLGMRRYYPVQVYKGLKKDLDNRMLGIAATHKAAFSRPGLRADCDRQASDFLDRVERADRLTSEHLQQLCSTTNFRFSEHYHGTFLLRPQTVPDRICHMCGQPVIVRSQRHIVHTDVLRDEYVCASCGGIEDRPDGEFTLRLDCAPARVGSIVTVGFTIDNHSSTDQRGYGCVAVRNSTRWGLEVAPTCVQFEIGRQGRLTREFKIKIGNTVPHRHVLQAAFVNCQRIYLAMRPFWVVMPVDGGDDE